ncbi:MAG: ATP phosphoribosyltransferase regulatory subunit [Alphaproteobacteria bacterium]
MTQDNNSAALLPSGFVDLLPPEAEREFSAITTLMQIFSSLGYARVKPPLLEFEDSLFAFGPGASLASETFRLMDPLSHRMMGLRSDITTQIARIACSRLGHEPRPLRLTYANDVLRTKGGQHRTERQFCQVGCEIVGPEDAARDIESCVIALMGLKALGLQTITIDLAYPLMMRQIFDHYDVDMQVREHISDALQRHDAGALDRLDRRLGEILKGLLDASGSFETVLAAIKKLSLPREARESIEKLFAIANGVRQAIEELGFDAISITLDPVETRGFQYKTGFGFTLFAKNVSGALGRGGRYTIDFAGTAESATGFTLYMDTVAKIIPPAPAQNIIYVKDSESWAVVADLRRQGWTVLRGGAAERAAATHEYKNGKPEKIGK